MSCVKYYVIEEPDDKPAYKYILQEEEYEEDEPDGYTKAEEALIGERVNIEPWEPADNFFSYI